MNGKGRGITVTIKYGKGYEESWVVFTGTPDELREDIASYFGMPSESVAELTLDAIVQNATSIAHGNRTVLKVLGGTITETKDTADEAQQSTGSDPWAGVEDGKQEPPANPLLAEIEGASTIDALKLVYAQNQAEFAGNPELLSTWKTKGKALKAAA